MSEPRPKPHEMLPSRQLAAVVDRIIARSDGPRIAFGGLVHNGHYSNASNVRAGLDVNERQLYGWRDGDRPTVSVYVADRILLRSGLCWFDVWNEDTVRLPALTVTVHSLRSKRVGRGGRARARALTSVVHYGDLGTDWQALKHIQDVWEPAYSELEVAA